MDAGAGPAGRARRRRHRAGGRRACGPEGPIIAPLPGGTMNMLPLAIYGVAFLAGRPERPPWPRASSADRRRRGGGRRFLVAAMLGAPALWAPAREAARYRQAQARLVRARRAIRRAFSGRLRYTLDGGPREKAEALMFMCPLTSRALDNDADAWRPRPSTSPARPTPSAGRSCPDRRLARRPGGGGRVLAGRAGLVARAACPRSWTANRAPGALGGGELAAQARPHPGHTEGRLSPVALRLAHLSDIHFGGENVSAVAAATTR